jgi:hypothetical protein
MIGIVAGIVIAIGAFLPWATATAFGESESAAGFDGWEGKVCLIAGAGIAIRSFLAMKQGRTRQVAVAILIGGLIATGVGVYTAVTAKDQLRDSLVDEVVAQGIMPDETAAAAAVDQAMDSGQIKVSIAFGLYLVIAASLAAIGAGVMALNAKDPVPTAAGAPAGGFGAPPMSAPAPATSAPAPTETLPSVAEPMPPAPPEDPPSAAP